MKAEQLVRELQTLVGRHVAWWGPDSVRYVMTVSAIEELAPGAVEHAGYTVALTGAVTGALVIPPARVERVEHKSGACVLHRVDGVTVYESDQSCATYRG